MPEKNQRLVLESFVYIKEDSDPLTRISFPVKLSKAINLTSFCIKTLLKTKELQNEITGK